MPRVLISSYAVPTPDRDGGSKRIDDLISFFDHAGWSPTFVASQPLRESPYLDSLRQRGVPVFHGEPAFFEMLVSTVSFDLAVLCFWPTAEFYLPMLRRASPSTRVIVDSIDLHFLRHSRRITTGSLRDSILLDTKFGGQVVGELNAYLAADAVLAVSPNEADWINALLGNTDLAFPMPLSDELPEQVHAFEERRGNVFIGSFRHGPNVDAIQWLCREILPRIPSDLRKEHPTYVVGDAMDDSIRALARGLEDVRMVGWVPSLTPYLRTARVSVLPLRSGAGTKQKMIQSLLAGAAVVSTTIGAEGFDVEGGQDLLLADNAEDLAANIVMALTDAELWTKLTANGRRRILTTHGSEAARAALWRTVDHVMARPAKKAILPPTDLAAHHLRLVYQYEAGLSPASQPVNSEWVAHVEAAPEHRSISSVGAASLEPPDHAAEGVRLIAFYLPQFHPIPENDKWWGEGFTEWDNVRKARPLFPGHSQPRVPGYLGYYDLRDPAVRAEQASLAARHGLHGFAYYHYWFSGRRLLERPFDEVLASGKPDFPFCLCWANEPWSRRWDGSDNEVLMHQTYSAEDDLAHIRSLLPALADRRAIKVGDRPLLLVYQGWALPEPARTTDIWRTQAAREGIGELKLLAVETGWDAGWDATTAGFDGKVMFQPQFTLLRQTHRMRVAQHPDLQVYDYDTAWSHLSRPPEVTYPYYEAVFPAWDNTPRQGARGTVVQNASPEYFGRWLRLAVERATRQPPGERLVFVNAWNEWAEGCYLEPDANNELGYLRAVAQVTEGTVNVPDR